MSAAQQLRLLLWKNFVLQKRRPVSTVFEIGLPIFFVAILLLLRVFVINQHQVGATAWTEFDISKIPLNPPVGKPTWSIAFSPNSSDATEVMKKVAVKLGVSIQGGSFATEEAMVEELMAEEEKDAKDWKFLGGIAFTSLPSEKDITYKIRLSSSTKNISRIGQRFRQGSSSWYTKYAFPVTFDGIGPRSNTSTFGGPPEYYRQGFLALQRAVDVSIVEFRNSTFDSATFAVKMQRFPYPPYLFDPFVIVIQSSLPLLLMLSLVYTSLTIVRNVVYEKEKKLKESMKMMGLSGWLHWVAWFIKCFIFLLIPLCIVTIFLCVQFGHRGKMLSKSDASLVLVFLILYAISAIMFCFLVSSFFYRANLAAAAGGILWFLSYVPFFFVTNFYNDMSVGARLATCLDFNVAMGLASTLIGKFEGLGVGAQWSNLYDGVTVDDKFALGMVLAMLVADSFIYGLLTWYIEAIYPGEYGVPLPWNFPFKKSYWCSTQDVDQIPLIDSEDLEEGNEDTKDTSAYLEKEPQGLKAGIQIQGLGKVFQTDSGPKVAVKGTTLNMFEGQITSLLGHNGAGKTTTISMLTGLIPPSAGTAVVNGYDIRDGLTGIRKSLGICPQHNVLFDTLTVKEHLQFFAQLKGMTAKKLLKQEVDRMIEATGLVDKTNVLTRNLSGGMKRKLSVGIALIADSKIVMLDEPTSGMDPSARRFTWDLLQREREGRTMLLTTHFMDEADLLGDRIAIMADGVIKCCGSSLFLKNKYGVGYHMVIVKAQQCDVEVVTKVVTTHVSGAKLENNVGLELSYILPSRFSCNFEKLFTEIEERQTELGISSYGASITTLEEVFLKVGEVNEEESVSDQLYRQLSSKSFSSRGGQGGISNQAVEMAEGVEVKFEPREGTPVLHNFAGSCSSTESLPKNTGFKLFCQRWYAMFVKRLLHTRRYKISLVAQLLMPSIFTLFALISAKTFPKASDSPALKMDTTMFKENYALFSVLGSLNAEDEFSVYYKRQFRDTQTGVKNVTNEYRGNISKYIIETSSKDLGRFNVRNLVAYKLKPGQKKGVKSTVMFNNQAFHSPAVSLNAFGTALLMYASQSDAKITTINHPLPRTTQQEINDLGQSFTGFQISFNILFGMAFLASSFVVFLVQERSSKAKHVQFVSGVDPLSYWSSAYLWDMINYTVPLIVIVILIAAFQVEAYSGVRIGYITLILLIYGWAIIPVMYLFSFLFKVASTAFVRLTMLNVITGLATLLTVNILSIPSLDLMNVARALKYVFLIFPNYSLGQGLVDIYNNYEYLQIYNKALETCLARVPPIIPDKEAFCEKAVRSLLDSFTPKIDFQENYLAIANPGIGRYLIIMAAEGFVFFAIVIMIEYRICSLISKPCRGKSSVSVVGDGLIDNDVAAEKARIMNEERTKDDVLVLDNVTKVFGFYKQLVAVDRLCLGIPQGECFGLLGLNGAGKTTTFRMLTGDETMTGGSITIEGLDVSTDMAKVRQRLGYCPQFDALIDLLTGREQLTMYARLRGVPEERIKQTVLDLARALTVDEYIDKICKTYSGGNKRKLSTAISLVGDPPIVFLDEPTTGMDPGARRMLWDALSRQREEGKSVVITSHSMEECEALCTRLAIMVNGQFKCLGSPQHLKSKFGEGYTLLAKIGGGQLTCDPFKAFVESTFPGSILKDEHQGYVHYQIKDEEKSWARVFGIMEKAKYQFNLEDYSVSQTTLEQIFLNFARHQREDED